MSDIETIRVNYKNDWIQTKDKKYNLLACQTVSKTNTHKLPYSQYYPCESYQELHYKEGV